jgi:hypothetical protein
VRLLYQPRMIDEYGSVGGMRISRENRDTRRNPLPVALLPPQTGAAAKGSRRLTA